MEWEPFPLDDAEWEPDQAVEAIPTVAPAKSARLAKNDEMWNSLQDDIHYFYMVSNMTLAATMKVITEKHGFTASERKWKMKLKEWGYQKHLPEDAMKILVAKADKRFRDEGKDTDFLLNGLKLSGSKFENFRKRHGVNALQGASPSNPTPRGVMYFTPNSYDFLAMRPTEPKASLRTGQGGTCSTVLPDIPSSSHGGKIIEDLLLALNEFGLLAQSSSEEYGTTSASLGTVRAKVLKEIHSLVKVLESRVFRDFDLQNFHQKLNALKPTPGFGFPELAEEFYQETIKFYATNRLCSEYINCSRKYAESNWYLRIPEYWGIVCQGLFMLGTWLFHLPPEAPFDITLNLQMNALLIAEQFELLVRIWGDDVADMPLGGVINSLKNISALWEAPVGQTPVTLNAIDLAFFIAKILAELRQFKLLKKLLIACIVLGNPCSICLATVVNAYFGYLSLQVDDRRQYTLEFFDDFPEFTKEVILHLDRLCTLDTVLSPSEDVQVGLISLQWARDDCLKAFSGPLDSTAILAKVEIFGNRCSGFLSRHMIPQLAPQLATDPL